jgi:glycosyltransferase involved in cell wall biosynthesis
LINARKKGIDCANYEYLLFCDDDNWLNPDYIVTAFNIINADPNIGVLGGTGKAIAEQPVNIDQHLINLLNANGPQTWAVTDHWVYGAGSLLRKSVFINLMNKGWPQITAGRTGSNLLSGEDVEICFMFYLSGYKIIADDRLTFKHFIPLKRQTHATISGMAFWLSYSYYLIFSYLVIINKETKSLNKVSFELLKSHGKSIIKGVLVLMIQKLKTWKSPSLEQKNALLRNYGMICSIIKNRKKVISHNNHIKDILKTSI